MRPVSGSRNAGIQDLSCVITGVLKQSLDRLDHAVDILNIAYIFGPEKVGLDWD